VVVSSPMNWESFMAFNNVYGLGTIPTGGLLNGVPGPRQNYGWHSERSESPNSVGHVGRWRRDSTVCYSRN
jgi:hypothetical protein